MAKKNTTSKDTIPALPNVAATDISTPRRRTAQKSAAETATATAAGESVARHRKATPAKPPVQPEVAAVSVPEAATTPISITQEDIARLAFSYFEQRGYAGGSPEQDWFRAEQELLQLVG